MIPTRVKKVLEIVCLPLRQSLIVIVIVVVLPSLFRTRSCFTCLKCELSFCFLNLIVIIVGSERIFNDLRRLQFWSLGFGLQTAIALFIFTIDFLELASRGRIIGSLFVLARSYNQVGKECILQFLPKGFNLGVNEKDSQETFISFSVIRAATFHVYVKVSGPVNT